MKRISTSWESFKKDKLCTLVKNNALIVNTVLQITDTPTRISVTINKNNYSHDVIMKTKKMNVCCLSEKTPFEIFEKLGKVARGCGYKDLISCAEYEATVGDDRFSVTEHGADQHAALDYRVYARKGSILYLAVLGYTYLDYFDSAFGEGVTL